jgi:ElaB/YqjD/DUF883 family membrane-anchored ribosome-binding protein
MAEQHNLIMHSEVDPAVDDRSVEEIRQDIAARRESIAGTVDKLSDRFHKQLDWREYVAKAPLVAVGVAAGVGFLLSGILKPRPSPGERIMCALSDGIEDITDRFRSQLDETPFRKQRSSIGQTVKAAATAMITKAVADCIRDQVIAKPTDQQYSARQDYDGTEATFEPHYDHQTALRRAVSEG